MLTKREDERPDDGAVQLEGQVRSVVDVPELIIN